MGIVLEYPRGLQDLIETGSSSGELLSLPLQNSMEKTISCGTERWKLSSCAQPMGGSKRNIPMSVPVDAGNPTADKTHQLDAGRLRAARECE